MGTNSIFLNYMTAVYKTRWGFSHLSGPMGKYFQHQAFQATWTSRNYKHRARSMSPKENISLSALKYNRQEDSFPLWNFSGSLSPTSFPRKHCNACVLLHTIFSAVQNRAFRVECTYDQAAVILNLLLLNMTNIFSAGTMSFLK